MRRAPQTGNARRDARERIGARGACQTHGRGRCVLLVVGVQDEDAIERALDHRVHLIGLGGDTEGHLEEIAGIGQRVVGIDEGLADRIFVRGRRDRRHLGDQPVAGDAAMVGIGNVGRVVIEGRERADDTAHDRHGVRIAAETAIELHQLLMQHGVARNRVGEAVELVLARQFAVEQQVRDFHEARILGQLADWIAAVQQHAFVAIDIGQRGIAAGGRGEAGVIGEAAGFGVELADVDDVRTDRAGADRIAAFLVADLQ